MGCPDCSPWVTVTKGYANALASAPGCGPLSPNWLWATVRQGRPTRFNNNFFPISSTLATFTTYHEALNNPHRDMVIVRCFSFPRRIMQQVFHTFAAYAYPPRDRQHDHSRPGICGALRTLQSSA